MFTKAALQRMAHAHKHILNDAQGLQYEIERACDDVITLYIYETDTYYSPLIVPALQCQRSPTVFQSLARSTMSPASSTP